MTTQEELKPLTVPSRLLAGVLVLGLSAVLYGLPNRFPLRMPVQLPWTQIDASVPFVPQSVWLYVSSYVLLAGAFLVTRSRKDITELARVYLPMAATGSVIHWGWPTVFPRDAFPIIGDDLTHQALALLRQADSPISCLPSMHVASAFLMTFALWKNSRRWFVVWLFWSTMVAISTLTVKQHYWVDVSAGLLLALIFGARFFRPSR